MNFARVVYEGYTEGQGTTKKDYMINPLITPDSILKHYPKTRILAATKDVLRDESYLFLSRAIEIGMDIKLSELMNFPHGFLNYSTGKFGIKGAELGLDQIIFWVDEFSNNMTARI